MVVALLVVVVGSASACWLATGIGGLLTHGVWPDIVFAQSGTAVHELLRDPGRPMAGWPTTASGQLPSPWVFYVVLAGLFLVVLVSAALVLRFHLNRLRRRERGRRERGRGPSEAPSSPSPTPDT